MMVTPENWLTYPGQPIRAQETQHRANHRLDVIFEA